MHYLDNCITMSSSNDDEQDDIVMLSEKTETFLSNIHRKCRYWLQKIPQLFPRVNDISNHLTNALSSYNTLSDQEFVRDLIGDNVVNTNTVKESLLHNSTIDVDIEVEKRFNDQVSSIQRVIDAIFVEFKDSAEEYSPSNIAKSCFIRIQQAFTEWIKVEFYASLAYLWVRKKISTQAVNLLLESLYQLSFHPNCIKILQSGPRNVGDFLVYLSKSTKSIRLYSSTVQAGEYDTTKHKDSKHDKLGAQEHDVVFSDPLGGYEGRIQSLQHQQYCQLLTEVRQSRDNFS